VPVRGYTLYLPPPPKGPFNLADHFLGDRLREGLGERPAILCGERSFSYREVEAMACRFAHRSPSRVEPEERVMLALGDGPAFVAAFFGVLKVARWW